jgi:glycine C-acetyltransferase
MAVPMSFITEELDRMKKEGFYGNIRTIESPQGPIVKIGGKEYINLCSNNYLGFCNHPELVQKVKEAVDLYGVGPGAVRTIAGTMSIHIEFEKKIAQFKGCEAAILLQSGFCANLAVLPTLAPSAEDIIFSDSLNHASIIDSCKLSKAKVVRYEHSDMNDLMAKIKEYEGATGRKMLVTDGVFSMDGDIAKLPEIVDICDKHGIIVVIDDAHGEGVLGKGGRGIADHFGLHGRVDVEVGTLSKAFGVMGGIVAGKAELVDYIRQKARPNLFSSALTVPDVAANIAAVDILQRNDDLVRKLWENGNYIKAELNKLGFNTAHSMTPITPVIIGEATDAKQFGLKLFENGVFATPIVFPTVPKGTARIRVMVSAAHTKEHIDDGVAIFAKVGREMGIIK